MLKKIAIIGVLFFALGCSDNKEVKIVEPKKQDLPPIVMEPNIQAATPQISLLRESVVLLMAKLYSDNKPEMSNEVAKKFLSEKNVDPSNMMSLFGKRIRGGLGFGLPENPIQPDRIDRVLKKIINKDNPEIDFINTNRIHLMAIGYELMAIGEILKQLAPQLENKGNWFDAKSTKEKWIKQSEELQLSGKALVDITKDSILFNPVRVNDLIDVVQRANQSCVNCHKAFK